MPSETDGGVILPSRQVTHCTWMGGWVDDGMDAVLPVATEDEKCVLRSSERKLSCAVPPSRIAPAPRM